MMGAVAFAQFHPDLICDLMTRRVGLPEVIAPDGAAAASARPAGEMTRHGARRESAHERVNGPQPSRAGLEAGRFRAR